MSEHRYRCSLFIRLGARRETIRILFCNLNEPRMIASFLMFFIFLRDVFILSHFRFFLFSLGRTIRVGRTFLLLFRFSLLRRLSTLFANIRDFEVRGFGAISLRLNFIMIIVLGNYANDNGLFAHFLFSTIAADYR